MKPVSLEASLRDARILVCAGTGGVGKTTISAALAIQAAQRGRRTLVLTIDPARRLADALGLEELGPTPTPVDFARGAQASTDEHTDAIQAAGLEDASLEAMMLDAKPTFDRLITRLTTDEAARKRILENRFYHHITEALAGSADYAAMEQVDELVESGRYDLIVVDTPPADHALDFLRAPRRLREFLDSRFVHALVRPAMSASRLGLRFFARPLHRMLGLLERIAGVGFLDDLSEFLSAIDGLSQGFQDRATRVEKVLFGPQTGFVLISGAEPGSSQGAVDFLMELETFEVPLVAVVVNRVRPWPCDRPPSALLGGAVSASLERDRQVLADALRTASPDRVAGESPDALAETLVRSIVDYAESCDAGQRVVDTLSSQAARQHVDCHPIPELPGQLDGLAALLTIGASLTKPRSSPPTPGAPSGAKPEAPTGSAAAGAAPHAAPRHRG